MSLSPLQQAARLPVECWDYGLSDLLGGIRASWERPEDDERLQLPGIGDCMPLRSARCGIEIALKALGLPAGARVAVPLYCCPVVFKAVHAAGMSLRFIDVDADSFCMSAEDLHAKRHDCDAVIAVHAFGQVCDMPSIVATGLPVIEDCALALASSVNGTQAGLFGDIAVFSFRSGKYLSVGEGGALYARDPQLHSRLRTLAAGLRTPTTVEEGVHLLKTFSRSALRSRPLWGLVGRRIWSVYGATTDFSAQTPIVRSKIFRSDLSLVRDRIGHLHDAVQRQRSNAQYYAVHVSSDQYRHQVEPPGHTWNRYLYPLLVRTAEHRDPVAQVLRRHGISTIEPYKDIARVAAAFLQYGGDCPNAESVAQRVLVPPGNFLLTRSDLQRVAMALNEACDTAAVTSKDPTKSPRPIEELE